MSTATGFRNGFAVAFFSAFAMLTAGEAAPPERDYGYNGCHAQTNRCLSWCLNNRTGDELGKCIANCHTYEDKCYAKKPKKAARAYDIAPVAPADPDSTASGDDRPAADSVAPKKKRVAKDSAKRRPD